MPNQLKVVAQSVDDPSSFTSSMSISDLLTHLNSNLQVKRVLAQVSTEQGFYLQPVGYLQVTFVADPQDKLSEEHHSHSQAPLASDVDEGSPSLETEPQEAPEAPKPIARGFWGLGKN